MHSIKPQNKNGVMSVVGDFNLFIGEFNLLVGEFNLLITDFLKKKVID